MCTILGDEIIQKGTEGNVFYLIKEGTVRVTDVGDGKTYLDHDLGPGEYFGERALITGGPRAANIRATTNVVLMALDRLSFDSLLGPLKDVLNQNMIMRVMNSVSWFKALSTNMRLTVARAFVLEYFETGKYFTVLDWIGLHCKALYSFSVNFYFLLHCITLYCTGLYCTVTVTVIVLHSYVRF